jgi:hypothetical protein
MRNRKFTQAGVKQSFAAYPKAIREKLLLLRELIYQIAEDSDEIGRIEETLKWESPSYLTIAPKSGTTIRLCQARTGGDDIAICVHCQSSLVSEFKEIYPELRYDGNRCLVFNAYDKLPLAAIKHFLAAALTYHHRKKLGVGL